MGFVRKLKEIGIFCLSYTSFYLLQVYFAQDNSEETILQEKKLFLRSYYALTVLAGTEQRLHDIVKDGHGLMERQLLLDRFLEDYLDSCEIVDVLKSQYPESESPNVVDIIAGHPILAYRMLHRYFIYLRPLSESFEPHGEVNDALQEIVSELDYTIGWPERSDLENAMMAILRIHHVYDLNLTEVELQTLISQNWNSELNGNVVKQYLRVSPDSNRSLVQAIHCNKLGNYGIKEGYYAIAVDWHEYSKFLIEKRGDKTVDLATAWNWLMAAIITHDTEWKKPNYGPRLFTKQLAVVGKDGKREKRRTFLANNWKNERGYKFNEINFWQLCSGVDKQTELEKSQLFCWQDRHSNLAWLINPLKVEQLSLTPPIWQYYQVLSDGLIEKLIQQANHRLMKSQVYRLAKDNRMESVSRTSMHTWLDDSIEGDLSPLPKLIEKITGLVVLPATSSEKIQVATYTFGGHYDIHQDTLKDPNERHYAVKGERAATFMIYLSDVEEGGYTAFPQGGVAAKPHVKGTAIFWFNTKRNGLVDENTWHGACPVLRGSKWVANKWIRINDQFQSRRCSLNPDE